MTTWHGLFPKFSHICMYVCMYTCMYVCMYVYVYVCMHVCRYAHISLFMYVQYCYMYMSYVHSTQELTSQSYYYSYNSVTVVNQIIHNYALGIYLSIMHCIN